MQRRREGPQGATLFGRLVAGTFEAQDRAARARPAAIERERKRLKAGAEAAEAVAQKPLRPDERRKLEARRAELAQRRRQPAFIDAVSPGVLRDLASEVKQEMNVTIEALSEKESLTDQERQELTRARARRNAATGIISKIDRGLPIDRKTFSRHEENEIERIGREEVIFE